jgi:predicted protein tyrosine phosphatase
MIRAIEFRSLAAMKKLRPAMDTVVISILDGTEREGRPRLAGFRSVLCLDFEDTYEEAAGAAPGSWPEMPTVEQHRRYAVDPGERTVTLADARRIVDFIMEHHRSPESLRLVAHCKGGISRSAAVAEWAAGRLYLPIENTNVSTEAANKRVLRLLDRAWTLKLAEEDADLQMASTTRPRLGG